MSKAAAAEPAAAFAAAAASAGADVEHSGENVLHCPWYGPVDSMIPHLQKRAYYMGAGYRTDRFLYKYTVTVAKTGVFCVITVPGRNDEKKKVKIETGRFDYGIPFFLLDGAVEIVPYRPTDHFTKAQRSFEKTSAKIWKDNGLHMRAYQSRVQKRVKREAGKKFSLTLGERVLSLVCTYSGGNCASAKVDGREEDEVKINPWFHPDDGFVLDVGCTVPGLGELVPARLVPKK